MSCTVDRHRKSFTNFCVVERFLLVVEVVVVCACDWFDIKLSVFLFFELSDLLWRNGTSWCASPVKLTGFVHVKLSVRVFNHQEFYAGQFDVVLVPIVFVRNKLDGVAVFPRGHFERTIADVVFRFSQIARLCVLGKQ